MPLCPRCGAAHHRELEVCQECGKRLLDRPQVTADQTSLSFPACIDGPDGCAGPPSEGPDGQLRCSAHRLAGRLRLSDQRPLICLDGPVECRGMVTLADDGQLRCLHHRDLADQPTRWVLVKRWFRRG